MKILFICRGNVGRSQVAEMLFRQIAKGRHEVISSGTKVSDEDGENNEGQKLKDRPSAKNTILALRERGIEVAENTRKQLDPAMVEWADKIMVMAEPETIPDYLAKSSKMIYWNVKDLHGTNLEEHRVIIDRIEELIKKFIKENSL